MANNITREAGSKLVGFLKQTAKEKGLSDYEIARRTGLIANNVWRIFNGKYFPSLENFLSICQAVGVRIELQDSGNEFSGYALEQSETGKIVFTDIENGIVCVFEKGKFNETQKFTTLKDMKGDQIKRLPTIMRKMGDWLAANHPDKV